MPASQTCTGRFDYANPDPKSISPIDLAVHLSRINRFLGGTSWCEWSVAQHCLLASIMVEEVNGADVETPEGRDLALDALLHDATEAYYGDMPAPLQLAMRQEAMANPGNGVSTYEVLYRRGEAVVAAWAGRTPADFNTDLIKHVDLRMLATERHLFIAGPWIPDWIDLPDAYVTHHDLQAPADLVIASSIVKPLDDGAPQRILANRNALMWMPMQPHEAAGQWFARLHQLRPDLTEAYGRQAMPWLRWPKWAADVVEARQRAGFR